MGNVGLTLGLGGKKDMDTHSLGRQNKEITQTTWDAEDRKQTGHMKAGNNQKPRNSKLKCTRKYKTTDELTS